ncbi:MAG: elongation factor G [Acidimicrobiia bacterium]|nr:elongation factor G [Acidimicrobiia bacterium]
MRAVTPAQIRNVVLVGHGGAGKTTLAEALLHAAGATNRLGRVEDGNTVMDHDAEERERAMSMTVSLAQFEWEDHKVNLLDAPGFPDFIGEVAAALRVADLALFVISAVDGVEVQTEVTWRMAAALGIPRAIFLNKLDRERASFDTTLAQLQERFGSGIAPLQLPIGADADFSGVVDLLTATAYRYREGTAEAGPVPPEVAELEEQVRESLVEGIVAADDDLLEKYLEGEVPSADVLSGALAAGVARAEVFPLLCGSATQQVGVDRLLGLICEIGPSPVDVGPFTVIAGGEAIEVEPEPEGEPLAFVFKSVADRHVGQLSMLKVLSGHVHHDDHLVDTRTSGDVRLHTLLFLKGAEQVHADEAVTGDILAVAKLTDVHTNDTLAPKGKPVVVPQIEIPPPALPAAIRAHTQADDDKLSNAVHRLLDEDPSLRLERNEETHQTVLWSQGETHLRSSIDKLQRKFGVSVDTEEVHVAYRETISGSAEAEGRHKKQSGGRGQYGVCSLRVAPRTRGEGFEFVDAIVGGAIPRQYIPAVEKGIAETMAEGGVLGFPVVDVQVTCYDGKYHAVDSDEMSFKIAGRSGFKEACQKASPVLLEPISRVEIIVPTESQGDVLGDLNARRGRVQGTEAGNEGEQLILAYVPTAELLRYAIDLRSLSGGRGHFTAEHDHYDPVPGHLAEKVIAEANAG